MPRAAIGEQFLLHGEVRLAGCRSVRSGHFDRASGGARRYRRGNVIAAFHGEGGGPPVEGDRTGSQEIGAAQQHEGSHGPAGWAESGNAESGLREAQVAVVNGTAIAGTSEDGPSVQFPVAPQQQARTSGLGVDAIRQDEIVLGGEGMGRRDLKDRTAAGAAALRGSPVDVAVGRLHQAGLRHAAVQAVGERMNGG